MTKIKKENRSVRRLNKTRKSVGTVQDQEKSRNDVINIIQILCFAKPLYKHQLQPHATNLNISKIRCDDGSRRRERERERDISR